MKRVLLSTVLLCATLANAGTPHYALQRQWDYIPLGNGLGSTGIVAADIDGDGQTEIVLADGTSTFGACNLWHILRHQPATGDYEIIYAEESPDDSITAVAGYDTDHDGLTEIILAYDSGRVEVRHPVTHAVLHETDLFDGADWLGLAVGDADNDGAVEIVAVGNGHAYLLACGGLAVERTLPQSSYSVAIGNVDDDANLETVFADGTVSEITAGGVVTEWAHTSAFGATVALGDSDGDGINEIIGAQSWYRIDGYDARLKATEWTLSTDLDIACMRLQDVDGDGQPELLYGDGQWGSIYCHDLQTRALLWSIPNPEHGVTDIAVGDLDHDGAREVLWGAGYTSTGSDYLFIHDVATGVREWQSADLDPPFTAVAVGDVDGDGATELVGLTYASESDYENGRLVVVDAATRRIEWTSPASLFTGALWTGALALALGDVDGDGDVEVVVGSDDLYDGRIYVIDAKRRIQEAEYALDEGSPITTVAVVDVDGDGAMEIVAGGSVVHTGSDGCKLYVLNGSTGAVEYTSPVFASSWAETYALRVADWDGDSHLEVLVTAAGEDVYLVDTLQGYVQNQGRAGIYALTAGDWDGDGIPEYFAGNEDGQILVYDRNGYKATINAGATTVHALDLADVDGDGAGELVVAMAGQLAVYSRTRGLLAATTDVNVGAGWHGAMHVADWESARASELLLGSAVGMHQYVLGVDDTAPVAIDDHYATGADTPLTVAAPGVLGNDTDAEGDALIAHLVAAVSHGSLTLTADGAFTYTPAPGYAGPDSFSYRASDGTLDSNVATVTLNVGAANHAPVAIDDQYATSADTPLTVPAPGVLANDTDADGDALTAVKVTNPAHGTVTLNRDGSLTYAPNTGYTGADSFTYQASDGTADSNVAAVAITVNNATSSAFWLTVNDATPDVNDLIAITVHADVMTDDAFVFAGQLLTFDNTKLELLAQTPGTADLFVPDSREPAEINASGEVRAGVWPPAPVSGDLTLGVFIFKVLAPGTTHVTSPPYDAVNTPFGDLLIAADYTYIIPTTPGPLAISIGGGANNPPVAADVSVGVTKDKPVTFALAATDADGQPLTFALVSLPVHGTAVLAGSGPEVTYTPARGYVGPDSFTYRANDGLAGSNTATVTVTVKKKKPRVLVSADGSDSGCALAATGQPAGLWLWLGLLLLAYAGRRRAGAGVGGAR